MNYVDQKIESYNLYHSLFQIPYHLLTMLHVDLINLENHHAEFQLLILSCLELVAKKNNFKIIIKINNKHAAKIEVHVEEKILNDSFHNVAFGFDKPNFCARVRLKSK